MSFVNNIFHMFLGKVLIFFGELPENLSGTFQTFATKNFQSFSQFFFEVFLCLLLEFSKIMALFLVVWKFFSSDEAIGCWWLYNITITNIFGK